MLKFVEKRDITNLVTRAAQTFIIICAAHIFFVTLLTFTIVQFLYIDFMDKLLSNQKFTIILIVALVGGAFFTGSLWAKVQMMEAGNAVKAQPAANNAAAPAEPEAGEVDPVTSEDWVRGDRSAPLALIEYSDLECPFCKQFHPTAEQLISEYDGQVMWVYRHFPLTQIHSQASKESVAAECAGKLAGNDGFWKYIDAVYEITPSNNGLDLTKLPTIATQIGLNQNAFQTCLDANDTTLVDADYDSGVKAGITGTPGNILLNIKTGETKLIPGAVPYANLKAAVDSML